jgi:hypothetical protein
MERNRGLEVVTGKAGTAGSVHGERAWLPPWLFRHEHVLRAEDQGQPITRDFLINAMNHIHFMDGHILVLLGHRAYEENIVMKAWPEPCQGIKLTCRWADHGASNLSLEQFDLLDLILDDGRSLIVVPASLKEINQAFFVVDLPEVAYSVGQRRITRYACHGVAAELIQNGFQAKGELVDFSPDAFRVKVKPDAHCSFRWLNGDEEVNIHIRREDQILFSGRCRCIRQQRGSRAREIALAPVGAEIKRFKKKQIRNLRQQLAPKPMIYFDHPLLRKRIQREVCDISTSGFSVCEEPENRVLLVGMIVPKLTVKFADMLEMECSAQVIYCREIEGEGFRCGLAILDMSIPSYTRLTHILSNALDPHAYISSEIDMEALWEFFFKTGFIYPKKYRLIQSHRKKFKETYQKLYQDNQEIARHFTYQKNGKIYGHISMVRAYERTWMIHHHAAHVVNNKRTGFTVLKQIMHYLNDMYRLPSSHMDYAMCYFRPENKFPNRVFGDFARELKNPQGCSLDLFAYLPYTRLSIGAALPEGFSLDLCTERDLWEVERHYNNHSGGLLLDAFCLGQEYSGQGSLEDVYSRQGFFRKCQAFALREKKKLNALLIVNQSNLGFNLSELLNGITVLTTDPAGLPWSVLSTAIAQLTQEYDMEKIPVMFYPFRYVEACGVPFEKRYQLWVLNVNYGNEFMEYVQRKFRLNY